MAQHTHTAPGVTFNPPNFSTTLSQTVALSDTLPDFETMNTVTVALDATATVAGDDVHAMRVRILGPGGIILAAADAAGNALSLGNAAGGGGAES